MQLLLMLFTCVLFTECTELQSKGLATTGNRQQSALVAAFPAKHQPVIKSVTGQRRQDFWQVVRSELRMPIPEHPSVQKQKRRYLRDTYHLNQVVQRAEPYIYWIAEQIRQHQLPMELLLLPMVESAFDPQANSNKQAVGLWQITPETGRHYGLIQNKWYDSRRDIVHSTTAALQLLRDLNQRFKGDWLLTLAAYNSGKTRVAQAISAQKNKKGGSIDYWSLELPRETKVYVAKLLAISHIVKQANQYGLELPVLDHSKSLIRVDVAQFLTLSQAAKMADLSVATLKIFNPGYQQVTASPIGTYHLMLPRGHIAGFNHALSLYNNQLSQHRHYTQAVVPTSLTQKNF